ncbi:hypothetical protein D3C81_1674110 [compost metagenome]
MYLARGKAGLDHRPATWHHVRHAIVDFNIRPQLTAVEYHPIDAVRSKVGDQGIAALISLDGRGVQDTDTGNIRDIDQAAGFAQVRPKLDTAFVQQQCAAGIHGQAVVLGTLGYTSTKTRNGRLITHRQLCGLLIGGAVCQRGAVVQAVLVVATGNAGALAELSLAFPDIEGGGGRAAEVQGKRNAKADLSVAEPGIL